MNIAVQGLGKVGSLRRAANPGALMSRRSKLQAFSPNSAIREIREIRGQKITTLCTHGSLRLLAYCHNSGVI